jgi:hypothetical protein
MKSGTWLSVLFCKAACYTYAVVLTKFKKRIEDTEQGTEERFNEALDITKNMGFKDRTLCRLASLLTSISFWFMDDLDEQQIESVLTVARVKKEADEQAQAGDE